MGYCTIRRGCGANVHHDGCPEASKDRGDFGMPGLGVGSMISVDMSSDDRPEPVMTIKPDGVDVDFGNSGYTVNAETHVAKRILRKHLPKTMEHFLQRNAEYGDDDDFDLGTAGQYVDISRKVQKLKRRWWDRVQASLSEESDEVIVMELIGHLLMALDMMEQQSGQETEG